MNLFPRQPSGIFFFSLLLLASCGDIFTPDSEVHMLNTTDKEWLYDSDIYPKIILDNSVGQSNVLRLDYEWSGYNSSMSRSGMLGLKDREKDKYEYVWQEFTCSEESFSFEIEAQEPPQGTVLQFQISDLYVHYDLLYGKVFQISMKNDWEHDAFLNNRYNSTIRSRINLMDSLVLGGETYFNAIKFELKDFVETWTDSTIVSFSYAMGTGLLGYETHGGVVWERRGD